MIAYTFIIVVGLLIVSYRIKNLPEEFSITRELAMIMIIVILQMIVYIIIVAMMYETNEFAIDNKDGILSGNRYLYFISAF